MSYSADLKSAPVVKRKRRSVDCTDKQLLSYIKEDELIRCVGPDHYQHLKATLIEKSTEKVTLKAIKSELVINPFYNALIG